MSFCLPASEFCSLRGFRSFLPVALLCLVAAVGCGEDSLSSCECDSSELCVAGRCIDRGGAQSDSGTTFFDPEDGSVGSQADASTLDAGSSITDGGTGLPTDAGGGHADAGVGTDSGSLTDSGSPRDSGMVVTDAGFVFPDSGAVMDAGPQCPAEGCEQSLFQYVSDGSGWRSQRLSAVFTAPGAPPVRGIQTGMAVCDFGLFCVGTEERYYCTPNLQTWGGDSWASAMSALPGFVPPTYSFAAPRDSVLGRQLWLNAGAAWWILGYEGRGDGSFAFTLLLSSSSPGQTNRNVQWASEPNAPSDASLVLADWIDVRNDGGGVWNLMVASGTVHRLSVASTGATEWLAPRPDPRFQQAGAPLASRVRAAASDCRGGLFVIAERN